MKKPTALTDEEKRVIKALLADGMRNQDIHTLINYEREATINFGRIAGIKKDGSINPASPEETAFFKRRKRSYDPITGLNLYRDERLIRAREAMVLAVTIFNGGSFKFKTEVFAVLANIAWTYLLHEHYQRAWHLARQFRRHDFRSQLYVVARGLPFVEGHEEEFDVVKDDPR